MTSKQADLTGATMPKGTAATPPDLIERLESYIGRPFTLDAAASAQHHICDNYLTEQDDFITLKKNYLNHVVFLNPPYSKTSKGYTIYDFVRKADYIRNTQSPVIIAILLESNTTSTRYFQEFIGGNEGARKNSNTELYFPAGRVNFNIQNGKKRNSNRMASMVIIMRSQ